MHANGTLRAYAMVGLVILSLSLANCVSRREDEVFDPERYTPVFPTERTPFKIVFYEDQETETPPTMQETPLPEIVEEIFKFGSNSAVFNGITAPTTFTINEAWLLTVITTYHWNDARGATPGTIGLRAADGTTYGPWQASGLPGQGGVPDAYWVAHPGIVIPPGTYSVIDSDPSTWAQNADTGGAGMAWASGVRQGNK
ncbi:MAG: hypothetical protein ABIL11_14620 [Chloroflexota bacterium]